MSTVSIPELIAKLRDDPSRAADVRLSIHDSARGHWIGYGALVYKEEPSLLPGEVVDTLGDGPGVDGIKLLNNLAYNGSTRGSWGEPQTFLVEDPVAEIWSISIQTRRSVRPHATKFPPQIQPPRLAVTVSGRPQIGTFSVPLRLESNGMYSGLGQCPIDGSETAIYTLSLGVTSILT